MNIIGTYASVTSTETIGGSSVTDESIPHLRKLVSSGDILLGIYRCIHEYICMFIYICIHIYVHVHT